MVQRVHRSADTATVGWLCWAGLEFDAERVSLWLRELIALPGVRRVKAVLRGSNGWCSFNFADGAKATKPSGYRRDSRIELVVDGAALPDTAALDASLRACVRASPSR